MPLARQALAQEMQLQQQLQKLQELQHGVSFDGTANISLNNNAITNGAGYITATLTNEQVQDIVGGMLTGNTETGITVTYQDSDGTIDFVVGTLNQDTTGNAATATALETARNIGGVSFDGTANINLPGVNTAGNQNTSGTCCWLQLNLLQQEL